jgi:arylsulfatase A-like enzyme
MNFFRFCFLLLGLGLSLHCAESPEPPKKPAPNILFLAIDDLRPQLGAYGESYMHTPRLDGLAAEGRLFTRHYVQVPTCGASRFSLLTGVRPASAAHLRNSAFETLLSAHSASQPESFVHLFRQRGYYTAGLGKMSHMPDGKLYEYNGEGDGAPEMPLSWNESWGPIGKWGTSWNAFFGYSDGNNRNMERGKYPAFERAAVADTALPDGLTAQRAIEMLQQLKDTTFFLGVGFFKPHLPFTAPAKYWDLYDADSLPLSPNPEPPLGIAQEDLANNGEMFGNYRHEEKGGKGIRISDESARELRHAYVAAVSYVDAQVGKVLDELDRLGLAENTIVVVWGDHGWHLGDHTVWGKHTTFERSLRSTLIVRSPDIQQPGLATDGLVESLDLYPTLLELAGIDSVPAYLTGSSFVPLLKNPAQAGKQGAFGYWRGGRTLRTERYRITEYPGGEEKEARLELFDHETDPFETRNLAAEQPEIVAELLPRLRGNKPNW